MFSFSIILYELFARAMLVFTELPVGTTDPTAPDRYADTVADGYRPRKTSSIHPDVWELITDCWQQDPLERPDMDEVGGGGAGSAGALWGAAACSLVCAPAAFSSQAERRA